MYRKYKVVDVFSSKPLFGNPVAVVLDAEDLSTDQMQSIARWTNLSETTFVLPPKSEGADYFLRIFTPGGELPFAGHPTLGSVHAVIEEGICKPKDGRLVQECGVGLVSLLVEDKGEHRKLVLQMPLAKQRELTTNEIAELDAIIGEPVRKQPVPALVDVGPIWIVAEMEDSERLLSVTPDLARLAKFEGDLGATGLSLYGDNAGGIEARSFAPSSGVNEDPVCGSGNGSIASFRLNAGQIGSGGSYITRQGCKVGRDGTVSINISDQGAIFVGGECVTTATGTLQI